MISITPYNKQITALHVFIIIISIVICDDPVIDYDLPTLEDSNSYDDYYFRPCSRYRQSKLEPQEFFKSIYNYWYRVIPKPHSSPDYGVYRNNFYKEVSEIKTEEIVQKYQHYEGHEASSDFTDERYAMEDEYFFEVTDKMYYQSNIFKKEYEFARQFKDSYPEPLAYTEYSNIMTIFELLPKDYENSQDFIAARVGLGKALGELFENCTSSANNKILSKYNGNVQYDTELADLSLIDVYIKGENYEIYALRMILQGKVPLHPETCNKIYGTNQSVNYEYAYKIENMDLKITSEISSVSTSGKVKSSTRMQI